MREIVFRGKTKQGEWKYGYLYITHNGEYEVGCYNETVNIERVTHIVIPETVGQYTGLEDKNGKSIFEGDIIAGAVTWLEKKKNGLVAFKDGSFGLIWYRGGIEQFNAFTSMCNIEYEIIGNIHDNGELLKGE